MYHQNSNFLETFCSELPQLVKKVREDDRAICGCHAINTEEVVKEGHWKVPLCVTDNPFAPSFHYCDLHWSPSWEEEKAPVNNATIFQGFQHHLGSRPYPTAWQWWSFGAQTWQHIRYFGFWMNWFSQCLDREIHPCKSHKGNVKLGLCSGIRVPWILILNSSEWILILTYEFLIIVDWFGAQMLKKNQAGKPELWRKCHTFSPC